MPCDPEAPPQFFSVPALPMQTIPQPAQAAAGLPFWSSYQLSLSARPAQLVCIPSWLKVRAHGYWRLAKLDAMLALCQKIRVFGHS